MSYRMFLSHQAKQSMIITSKNGKYELNDELPSDVRLKKISELRRIKLSNFPSQNENIVINSKKLLKTRY